MRERKVEIAPESASGEERGEKAPYREPSGLGTPSQDPGIMSRAKGRH